MYADHDDDVGLVLGTEDLRGYDNLTEFLKRETRTGGRISRTLTREGLSHVCAENENCGASASLDGAFKIGRSMCAIPNCIAGRGKGIGWLCAECDQEHRPEDIKAEDLVRWVVPADARPPQTRVQNETVEGGAYKSLNYSQ